MTNLTPAVQKIVSTAILLRTAFRLRDEEAMVQLLRKLCEAVEKREAEEECETLS